MNDGPPLVRRTRDDSHAGMMLPSSTGSLDMSGLANALLRRWKLLVTITGFVTALVVAATLLLTPVWTATTQIRIEPNRHSPVDFSAVQSTAPDQAIVDTEVNLIRSRDVGRRVVQQLKLVNDREFNKPSASGRVLPANEMVEQTVDTLLRKVDVARGGTTYLISISARSVDPDKAAAIANAFASQYISSSVESRVGSATAQSATLRTQLAALGREVQGAEAQVAQYRARTGIVQGGTNGTITDQQVAPLSSQLATAEAQAAAARSNAEVARGQIARGGFDAVSGVLNSPVIVDLRRQRAEVLRRQGEVNARYGPRHPESISLAQQMGDLDKQLREESRRIVSGIDGDARATAASAASLRGDLTRLRDQQAGNTRAAVEAESLERVAEAKRTVYNQLAQAAQQTAQQRQGSTSLGQVIEVAEPPSRPSFPNKPLFILLGLFAGLISGLAVIVVLEVTKTTILSSDDVEREFGAPFLASIKRLAKAKSGTAPWDVVAAKPMSAFSETMRSVRSSLVLNKSAQPMVVAITSALPAEGKTMLSASLGRIMAMSGDKVVLVDCDLRRNALRSLAPSPEGKGLLEVLDGSATLDTALVSDTVSDLYILQPTKAEFSPRDLFGGREMSALIDALGERFDYILLDTPPVLAVADTTTLLTYAQSILFLIRWNKTSRYAVRSALKRMSDEQNLLVNIVLTMTETQAGVTSSSDPAYYSKAYSKYYQE